MENFQGIIDAATVAGFAAVEKAQVRPMVVQWESGGVLKQEYVEDGVCGFAWVTVKGNTAFARWAKDHGFRKGYPKGLQYWVGEFNQSMQKKEAFARGFAKVLNENGIEAYADSRMD